MHPAEKHRCECPDLLFSHQERLYITGQFAICLIINDVCDVIGVLVMRTKYKHCRTPMKLLSGRTSSCFVVRDPYLLRDLYSS